MQKISPNQKLLDHMKDFAVFAFKETGEVRPMWLMMDAKGKVQPVIAEFETPEDKDKAAEFIRLALRAHKAVRYGFMSEAWFVAVSRGHPDFEHPEHTQPSRHQDRREIIQFMVEDDQGSTLGGRFFILRPEIGKPSLSPFTQDEGLTHQGGRFSGLLQKT